MFGRVSRFAVPKGAIMGGLILVALFFFELFNFSTTDFALHDLLGDLEFLGMRWSTILAIAFCGIDFAGIARLFAGEDPDEEVTETWYLFGAWFLAATMNAMLTWWGVSVALLEHVPVGSAVLGHETVMTVVPIFVAILVWLVRILLIGTITVAGPRLFTWDFGAPRRSYASPHRVSSTGAARMGRTTARSLRSASSPTSSVGSVTPRGSGAVSPIAEPTYEPLATAPRSRGPKRMV